MVSKESKFTEQIGALIGGRYKVIKTVGAGTYGAVFECADITNQNKSVAIKKLHRLEDKIDGKRVLREIRILRCCEHENILKLKDLIHKPDESGDLGDIYLVTDLFETDLYSILKSKQELTDEHAQYFVYQVLRALKFLHSAGIVHRDIKPSNILVNGNCDIALCDFGLARSMEQEQIDLTEYVVTRFYRAPEIMLCSQHYNKAVDVWSVGCTLGEVLAKRVLFPGSNYVKQINYIIDCLGTPSKEDQEFITNPHAKKYIGNMEPKPPKDLKTYVGQGKEVNSQAVDLLGKMLKFNPINRITVDEALQHPYLEQFYDPEDEPLAPDLIENEFEKDPGITYEQLKDLIREEFKYFGVK